MKRIATLLLLSLALTTGLTASHIIGGTITYRYIGDSTGVANQYQLLLSVYRDCSLGTSTSVSDTMRITSSCYPNQYISASQIIGPLANGEFPTSSYLECVSPGSATCISIRKFQGTVTLPGYCSDYKFVYQDCCRPANITNLTNSAAQSFYFDATLNNFLGNQNSATTYVDFARAFCVGQNAKWKPKVVDADGDSLYFYLSPAKGINQSPLNYASPFTFQNPIATSPANNFSINQKTGEMQFAPTAVGTYILAFTIVELNFDTIYGTWVNVGKRSCEMVAVVTATCNPLAGGVYFDFNDPSIYLDVATGMPAMAQSCLDTVVRLPFLDDVDCTSIAPNGSDFKLNMPNGQPIPIKSAVGNCNSFGTTKEVFLILYLPINANGNYYLFSKTGSDGNTLIDGCGFAMYEYDTILVQVNDCSGIGLAENVLQPAPQIPSTFKVGGEFDISIPEGQNGNYQLSFYNLQGALLFTEMFSGAGSWPVKNRALVMQPGMFVCRLQNLSKPDLHWQQKVLVLP